MNEEDIKKAKDEAARTSTWLSSEEGRQSIAEALKRRRAVVTSRAHLRLVSREQLSKPVTL